MAGLFTKIEDAVVYRQAIIPCEVKSFFDNRTPPSYFSLPSPAPDTEAANRTKATLAHSTLCRIRRAAMTSARHQRHEQAWNNKVHSPLLELLCQSENDTEHGEPLRDAVVQWEPMMSATIAGDSIPRLSSRGGGMACSVSVSSTGESSQNEPKI